MSYKTYENYKDSNILFAGGIPKEWEVRSMRSLFLFGRGRVISNEEIGENGGLYPVYSSQTKNNGVLGYIDTYDFNGEYVTWTTDGANAGTVFYREGKFNCTNVCGTISPKQENIIHLKFLPYYLNLATKEHVRYDINPKLMNNVMGDIHICFPTSLDEQNKIIDYLDKKTSEIDQNIAKNKELISLLEEKKTALINQVVTKGLDPNVPMKDSGIEWIGEIPEHWECRKINTLASVKRGASPRPIDDPKYFDDNGIYSWVRISDVTSSEKYLEKTQQKLSSLGKSLSVPMEPGNIFVSIAGTVGKPIITQIKCCIHDGFVYFKNLDLNDGYLFYIFEGKESYKGLGKLGTQLNLNTETIGRIYIPVPPRKEQTEIEEYLEIELNKINYILNKIQENIDLLEEYKTSLIHHAVTGKIDVRDEI